MSKIDIEQLAKEYGKDYPGQMISIKNAFIAGYQKAIEAQKQPIEEILSKINNTEFDANGDPLYSYEQMMLAIEAVISQKQHVSQSNIKKVFIVSNDNKEIQGVYHIEGQARRFCKDNGFGYDECEIKQIVECKNCEEKEIDIQLSEHEGWVFDEGNYYCPDCVWYDDKNRLRLHKYYH